MIKAHIVDPNQEVFTFSGQKTMYGGKSIAAGDIVFLFASETEGGDGLVARGVVVSAEPAPTSELSRARRTFSMNPHPRTQEQP